MPGSPSLPVANSSRIGERLGGRYRLLQSIGEGSMAQVFEVVHEGIGRRMAVKVLHRHLLSNSRAIDRFEREAFTLGRLQSEHIVSVTDRGLANDGCPYLVMELLEGCDLRKLLQDHGRLPPGQAISLLVDACRGLQCAHAQGVVHRDLKPENLFIVRQSDGRETCKIVDFGVVKVTDVSTLSHAGTLIGTIRYMAPEQAQGSHHIDGRADVFALGAIMSECLSGLHAFSGNTQEEVLQNILNGRPRILDKSLNLPERLCDIVNRALATDKEARFASVHDLRAALSRLHTYLPDAPPSSNPLRELTPPLSHSGETATEPEFDSLDEVSPLLVQQAPAQIATKHRRAAPTALLSKLRSTLRSGTRLRLRALQLTWAAVAGLAGWLAGHAYF